MINVLIYTKDHQLVDECLFPSITDAAKWIDTVMLDRDDATLVVTENLDE